MRVMPAKNGRAACPTASPSTPRAGDDAQGPDGAVPAEEDAAGGGPASPATSCCSTPRPAASA
ncbi:MAG: hypothetical protein MZW92_49030 [Comamonadaceae bacterium]|nr:hypothetical protein [Comamonadaceae bacterium]